MTHAHWIPTVEFDAIDNEDVVRFDHASGRTFAIYRVDDQAYATDGLCTHEKIHLCDGLVMEHVIECPKHNGRFDLRDGRPLGAPVCVALRTYPAKVENGQVCIAIED
jgi:3-phenylpropionate/trans-cinnamate dioxygenase ferredoxin subunit